MKDFCCQSANLKPAFFGFCVFIYLGGSFCDDIEIKEASKSDLIFAHVLYRHGDRSPGKRYPNDPHGHNKWPMGAQELTPKGMMQHYLLGKYLRKRYSKLLNEKYLVNEIYVRSSDKDRALQSAASNLAGLYPPVHWQKWSPNLDWQPVPIHSVPTSDDYVLTVDNPCPLYHDIFINQTKGIIDSYNNRYEDFFNDLRRWTGLEQVDFMNIGDIYDPLICESAHDMELPDWTRIIVNQSTQQTVIDLIVQLKTISKNLKYNSDEKALLTGGPLLGEIISRMTNVTSNPSKHNVPSKMVMYSAHDDTVMALLYALNVVTEPFMVPYAAAVFIDLYRNIDGGHYVEIYYKNNTPEARAVESLSLSIEDSDSDSSSVESLEESSSEESSSEESSDRRSPIRLIVPGCPDFKCPLDIFANVLSNRVIYPASKRDAECGIKPCPFRPIKSDLKTRLRQDD